MLIKLEDLKNVQASVDFSAMKKDAPFIRANNKSQDFTTATRLNRKQALLNQSVDLPYPRDGMDTTIINTDP